MTNTRELVTQIKNIIADEGYEFNDIKRLMEEIGDVPISLSTFNRLMEESSEDNRKFHYDYTLAPLARALGVDAIDGSDSENTKALKEMLRLKRGRISELEQALAHEVEKRHSQVEEARSQAKKSIDFLREQLEYKDKRMDEFSDRISRLLDRLEKKDNRIEQLTDEILALKDLKDAYKTCPYKNGGEKHGNDPM